MGDVKDQNQNPSMRGAGRQKEGAVRGLRLWLWCRCGTKCFSHTSMTGTTFSLIILEFKNDSCQEVSFPNPGFPPPAFKKILFIFREGKGGERERNINVLEMHRSVAFCMVPTGALAHNPGMRPDWELNR